ncbi:MAG: hypothetical protein R2710_03090 [Acidimicrobiales bacterium]
MAREVADVSGTLPPVLESVAEGIDQVNGTVVQLNALLDSLPFTLGDGGQLQTFDPILTDVDPLLEDLREPKHHRCTRRSGRCHRELLD